MLKTRATTMAESNSHVVTRVAETMTPERAAQVVDELIVDWEFDRTLSVQEMAAIIVLRRQLP